MTIRTRYAPSPTGHLHIGGARTALFCYLAARRAGGTFILRIEDTDTERNRERAADDFAAGLRWLGIEWDEGVYVGGPHGPYVCSERLDIYAPFVEELKQMGLAYECFCDGEDTGGDDGDRVRPEGRATHDSGRCRNLTAAARQAFRAQGRTPAVRFCVPDDRTTHFDDLIRGRLSFEPQHVGGDFVIVKSNGMPTYHFACVVDDHLMEITHVIRGEEHISNTPRQLYIYEAFGWKPPTFAHVPLILGPDGKKLSKRDESVMQFIGQYRQSGYLPEAMLNFLALLGWSPEVDEEILAQADIVRDFDLARVSRSGAIFDAARLAWMNGQYIKRRPAAELLPAALPFLAEYDGYMRTESGADWALELVDLYRDRVLCLAELPQLAAAILQERADLDEEAAETVRQPGASDVLRAFSQEALRADVWTAGAVRTAIQAVQAATGRRGKELYMPIRTAILGSAHGPDLNRALALVGQRRCAERAVATAGH